MITLEKSLKQMAWADKKLFDILLSLPDEAWRAKISEGEWDVAHYAFHLIASADWYAFELGQKLRFTKEPDSIDEIRSLGETWKEINAFFIKESQKDDEMVSFMEDGKEFKVLRSTVLSQALIHSVEHRIHIASPLQAGGFLFPDLADFSLWAYEASQTGI
jgi:uncharacterized damage-inducible protein DinB